jgi:hypothetical protein
MMKLLLIFLSALFLATSLCAEETADTIILSKQGTLQLKTCATEIDCTFSGTQTLSGRYEFGFSEICDTGEENGCVTMDFYPDDVTILPHIQGYDLKFINIVNFKEGAESLMGKALSRKVISEARAAIVSHMPEQEIGEVVSVKGTATLQMGEYNMGICCDSAYANAKILLVKKKSKPKMVNERTGT